MTIKTKLQHYLVLRDTKTQEEACAESGFYIENANEADKMLIIKNCVVCSNPFNPKTYRSVFCGACNKNLTHYEKYQGGRSKLPRCKSCEIPLASVYAGNATETHCGSCAKVV